MKYMIFETCSMNTKWSTFFLFLSYVSINLKVALLVTGTPQRETPNRTEKATKANQTARTPDRRKRQVTHSIQSCLRAAVREAPKQSKRAGRQTTDRHQPPTKPHTDPPTTDRHTTTKTDRATKEDRPQNPTRKPQPLARLQMSELGARESTEPSLNTADALTYSRIEKETLLDFN